MQWNEIHFFEQYHQLQLSRMRALEKGCVAIGSFICVKARLMTPFVGQPLAGNNVLITR